MPPGLSRGESVQIAIIRGEHATALHVEDNNTPVVAPFKLLTKYSNKPWDNPEQEILAPQRPPVPPTEYFTISLGGLDPEEFKPQSIPLPGFVGCLRGLRVADRDLKSLLHEPTGLDGELVSEGCHMKCDEKPCQNQGICTENFLKGESSCNCEHTSYFGPNCAEEKGASFNGDSFLHRKLNAQLSQEVRAQFAFSTKEKIEEKDLRSVLLLIDGNSEYFIVALNSNGSLEIEENLSTGKWRANLSHLASFTNGARHSVLYYRKGENANLLVDRKPVDLTFSALEEDLSEEVDLNLNDTETEEQADVQGAVINLGGLKLSEDERFKQYRNYSGCLSSEYFLPCGFCSIARIEDYNNFRKLLLFSIWFIFLIALLSKEYISLIIYRSAFER